MTGGRDCSSTKRLIVGSVTLLTCLLITSLNAWQQIDVRADRQSLISDRYMHAVGNVTASVDDTLQVRAPRMSLDQKTQQLYVHSASDQKVQIKLTDFSVIADHAQLNWQTQTGRLQNVVITGVQGVVRAKEMQRDGDGAWHLHDASYSGCSRLEPHWSCTAQHATLAHNTLSAYSVSGCVGGVPLLYLPWLRTDISTARTTGPLLPQFSYDSIQGFGVHQKFFVALTDAADATVGLLWRSRRGTIWSSQLQAAPDKTHAGTVSAWYGVDRKGGLDRFTGEVAQDSEYWIAGNGVYGVGPVQYLAQIAHGSDKRVSESFFTAPSDRDDSFSNTAAVRFVQSNQLAQASVRHDVQVRNLFASTLQTRSVTHGHEQYAVRRTSYVPQLQWFGMYSSDSLPLHVRHEIGTDWTIVRDAHHDITYDPADSAHTKLAAGQHMGRAWYHANAYTWAAIPGGSVHARWQPYMQGRIRGYRRGMHESLSRVRSGLLWGNDMSLSWRAWPVFFDNGGMYQASIALVRRDGTPSLAPFQIDEYERCVKGNELHAAGSGSWGDDAVQVRCDIEQVLQLGGQQHETVCACDVQVAGVAWRSRHQYCWKQRVWGAHEIDMTARTGAFEWQVGLLYANDRFMREREMFFDGGTIVSCGMKWYYGPRLKLWYTGKYLYQDQVRGVRQLLHDVGISYEGHCWQVRAGYTQTPHVQYGRRRAHQSLYLALSLRPLGRVGATFKQWR